MNFTSLHSEGSVAFLMHPLSRNMSQIFLTTVMKWRWIQWIFLFLMVSGTQSLVAIHQPPVLTSALGHDVVMPCHLNLSHDEKMMTTPVLYWVNLSEDTDNNKLWVPSEKYQKRVDLLDKNRNSSNKSILLKNIQWADSGKYQCKLSITTEKDKSFRKKGNETLLVVYDAMSFNVTSHNDSQLRCEVNMTSDHGFVLSISHDGCGTVDSFREDYGEALPYVTLSNTIPLQKKGKYECQLHLNNDLIAKSVFHYHPPVVGERQENISTTFSTIPPEPVVVVYPEPWILYAALLLVPVTILLGLVTALLLRTS